MYTLGEYIGDDAVNRALKRLAEDYSNQKMNFPTTVELLNYFRDETPDSMQYLITDLFETITLHDNQMISALLSEADDSYLLQLEMSSKKFRSDSIGNQTEIAVNDLIPVVVFGENDILSGGAQYCSTNTQDSARARRQTSLCRETWDIHFWLPF